MLHWANYNLLLPTLTLPLPTDTPIGAPPPIQDPRQSEGDPWGIGGYSQSGHHNRDEPLSGPQTFSKEEEHLSIAEGEQEVTGRGEESSIAGQGW